MTRWAAEPLDLLRELRELKPTIVHFSGHGARPAGTTDREQGRDVVAVAAPSEDEPSGVVFDSASGCGKVVAPEAFAQTLDAAGSSVRLVVLNTCYTAPIAEALLAHVDCVVGMSGGPIIADRKSTMPMLANVLLRAGCANRAARGCTPIVASAPVTRTLQTPSADLGADPVPRARASPGWTREWSRSAPAGLGRGARGRAGRSLSL